YRSWKSRRIDGRPVSGRDGEASRETWSHEKRRRHRVSALSGGPAAEAATTTVNMISSLLVVALFLSQSLTYSRGQNISPAYEGWEELHDGRYFVFGYMNRNWEEEIDVPVGPDNGFNVGRVDQGQPTHFLPRRNRFVFRVPVPEGFGEKDELIWTLTTHGKTEK